MIRVARTSRHLFRGGHTDVISPEPGPELGRGPRRAESVFDGEVIDRVHRVTIKPIPIRDPRGSFRTPQSPITLWHEYETQQKAVDTAHNFMLQATSKPYVIGCSYSQYLNERGPDRASMVKPRFSREDERPYENYVGGITAATKQMSAMHRKKLDPM